MRITRIITGTVQLLSLMENNLTYTFVISLCFLVSVSCNMSQSSSTNKVTSLEEQDIVTRKVNQVVDFTPDTTINGVLILNNARSSTEFYADISSGEVISNLRESPVIGFNNRANEEYLLLYLYEGSGKNEFSCFEIGTITNLEPEVINTDYGKFSTESGLTLGMSFEELIEIKGKSYILVEDKIIYKLADYSKSDFLKRHNMPAYFLECTLKNNSIIKIKYGFEYP